MGATRDLARLYECANGTKTINQAVKRHINKFPEQYMFQVNEEEFVHLCGPKLGPQNKKRFLPYVFTEHGIMMLSGLLKSEVAAKVNVAIINAFVAIKKYISNKLL